MISRYTYQGIQIIKFCFRIFFRILYLHTYIVLSFIYFCSFNHGGELIVKAEQKVGKKFFRGEGQQNDSEVSFANQDLRLDLQKVAKIANEMQQLFLEDGTPNMFSINAGG